MHFHILKYEINLFTCFYEIERFPYPDIKSLCQCNKSDQAELIGPG